jgi:hypothetical protein
MALVETPEWVYLSLSQIVACVFALSGVAKIARPRPVCQAIADFLGVKRIPLVTGAALGILELLVALGVVGFLPGPQQAYAAATLILCVMFVAFIAEALRAGKDSSCGCFGSADAPLHPRSLVRALLLAGSATLLMLAPVADPLGSAAPQHSVLAAAVVALWCLVGAALDLKGLNEDFLEHLRLERATEIEAQA